MKYDIPAALQVLTPGAEWVLRGEEYSGLEWVRVEMVTINQPKHNKSKRLLNLMVQKQWRLLAC